jgi:hypothetical protein
MSFYFLHDLIYVEEFEAFVEAADFEKIKQILPVVFHLQVLKWDQRQKVQPKVAVYVIVRNFFEILDGFFVAVDLVVRDELHANVQRERNFERLHYENFFFAHRPVEAESGQPDVRVTGNQTDDHDVELEQNVAETGPRNYYDARHAGIVCLVLQALDEALSKLLVFVRLGEALAEFGLLHVLLFLELFARDEVPLIFNFFFSFGNWLEHKGNLPRDQVLLMVTENVWRHFFVPLIEVLAKHLQYFVLILLEFFVVFLVFVLIIGMLVKRVVIVLLVEKVFLGNQNGELLFSVLSFVDDFARVELVLALTLSDLQRVVPALLLLRFWLL